MARAATAGTQRAVTRTSDSARNTTILKPKTTVPSLTTNGTIRMTTNIAPHKTPGTATATTLLPRVRPPLLVTKTIAKPGTATPTDSVDTA